MDQSESSPPMDESAEPGNNGPSKSNLVPSQAAPIASPGSTAITPEILARVFDSSAREMELRKEEAENRRREIALQEKQADQAHEYALKALDAQERDREKTRAHDTETSGHALKFFGLIVFAFVVVIIFAIWRDKDTFLLEIAKLFIAFLGGGGIGYGIGKKSDDADPKPTQS